MLVLSRKSQESVVVGGSNGFERLLKVTVLEISHGKVRLGFDVEKDIPVHRLEVWERISRNGHARPPTGGSAPSVVG
jgi:carbon storage regulator CsrA